MERRGSRGNARNGFCRAGGVHQHKTRGILRFRPHAFAFVVQWQYVAGGNAQRAGQRLLVRTDLELRIQVRFFQHVSQTVRRPVVDHAIGARHHKYAFVAQLFERHV